MISFPPLAIYGRQESWPEGRQSRRADPEPRLGNTVELALEVGVAGETVPRACVWERVSLVSCLLDSGTDQIEISSSPPSSLTMQAGRRAGPGS